MSANVAGVETVRPVRAPNEARGEDAEGGSGERREGAVGRQQPQTRDGTGARSELEADKRVERSRHTVAPREDDEGDGDGGQRHERHDVDDRDSAADLLRHGLRVQAHGHTRAHNGERHCDRAEEPEVAHETGRDRVSRARSFARSGHGEGP
jgi:hypothetical protein